MKKIILLASLVAIVFTLVGPATVLAVDSTGIEPKSPEAIASVYVVDLVATAAFGVAMNDAGDVTGNSYPDPGCGSSCLPPLEPVVWKGGERIVLPSVPGLSGVTTSDINNLGWISGFGGPLGFRHAAASKPTVVPTRLSTWACYQEDLARSPSGSTTTIGRSATPRRRPVVTFLLCRPRLAVWSTSSRRASQGNPARDQRGWNGGHGRSLVSPRRSWQRDCADAPS